MSAIGGVVDTEGPIEEPLSALVQALEHPNAERIGVVAGEQERSAGLADELDLAGLEAPWALVHVAGPAPEPGTQPALEDDGIACCVEDSRAHRILPPREGDPDSPADRLATRLGERLGTKDELGGALQALAGELVDVSALAAARDDAFALMRDPSGAIPLYAARGDEKAAFATSKRPLWALGLEVDRIQPDTLVLLHPERSQTIHLPRHQANRRAGKQESPADHADAFRAAVNRRVAGLDRVALMATHPAAAAALACALEDEPVETHAYVPDRANRKLNEAIADSVAPHVDEVEAVPLEEGLDGIGDLLDALEARNQGLVADALPPYVLSRAAAGDGYDVLLADRGPAEPHAHEALEAVKDRSAGDEPPVPFGAEGPLERAHKLARRAGVTLRAPRADPTVIRLEPDEGPGPTDRLARLAETLGADPIEAPPVVEPGAEDLREIVARVVEALDPPPVPEGYAPGSSLKQAGQGPAQPGRAIVTSDDATGLDATLQWGLDQAALDTQALGTHEHQRLERYIEDVKAYPTGVN